ncbi:MAG: helix-turn-helix domain-containing protein [Flavisolibacter sp.]
MTLEFISPRQELRPYIHQFWIFKSDKGLGKGKTLIAPNAKPKLMIPFKNALWTTDPAKTDTCTENNIYFIGIRDVPVLIGSSEAGETGSIGLEFTTAGAYKFFNGPMSLFTNNLLSSAEIFGGSGSALQERMGNLECPQEKVDLVQDFLTNRLLLQNKGNPIVDFSIDLITGSQGLVEIKEIQRKTGYSKRYLDKLFQHYLGISPKVFATITRFQHFYKKLSFYEDRTWDADLLDLYYDQAHFIKEFKRYTGHTPGQFASFKNDFGKYF